MRVRQWVCGLNTHAAMACRLCVRLPMSSDRAVVLRSLGPFPKTESVKLTFACPATLKADLDHYAALHTQTYGESVDAVTLIPYMLEAFIAGDRGFKKREVSKQVSQKSPQREAIPP